MERFEGKPRYYEVHVYVRTEYDSDGNRVGVKALRAAVEEAFEKDRDGYCTGTEIISPITVSPTPLQGLPTVAVDTLKRRVKSR